MKTDRPKYLAARLPPLMACAAILGGVVLLPTPALAYVGPGAGLTVIGSVVAVAAAVLIALIGLVLFPIRLLMKKMRAAKLASGTASNTADKS